jgi:hypothetical protein
MRSCATGHKPHHSDYNADGSERAASEEACFGHEFGLSLYE